MGGEKYKKSLGVKVFFVELRCSFLQFFAVRFKVQDKTRVPLRCVDAARRASVGVPPCVVPFAVQIQ